MPQYRSHVLQLRTVDRKPNANNESNIRNLWNTIKHASLIKTGIPEGKKKGIKNVFEEVIAENFPNLRKKHIQASEKRGS